MMRAVTCWQPWAHEMAHGTKNIENRKNLLPPAELLTPSPGELVRPVFGIHAGLSYSMGSWSFPQSIVVPKKAEVKYGAMIGLARVVGALDLRVPSRPRVLGVDGALFDRHGAVVGMDRLQWWLGPIGWLLTAREPLRRPVPCKGALGCWRVPPDVEADVRRENRP